MQPIKQQLQESEDESENGYQLKSNGQIIEIISEFGNGETEFHTCDIERLVVENERVREMINSFEISKETHELPNNNSSEFNEGYVAAMNYVINQLNKI